MKPLIAHQSFVHLRPHEKDKLNPKMQFSRLPGSERIGKDKSAGSSICTTNTNKSKLFIGKDHEAET